MIVEDAQFDALLILTTFKT